MEMKYESFSFIHEATVKKCLFKVRQNKQKYVIILQDVDIRSFVLLYFL